MSQDPGRPDLRTILDWLEGRMDPNRASQVAGQVARADERTQATVEWLRGFLMTARALPLHEPPPIVRQNLRQHFARWSRAQAELGQKPRVIWARLLFDSRQDLALAGVRAGAGSGEAAHLAYAADEGDLLLDVYQAGAGRVRLDGQVLLAEPRDPQGTADAPVFEASVSGAGFMIRTTDGDELGRFSLTGVPEAACQLRASNGLVAFVADVDLSPENDQP